MLLPADLQEWLVECWSGNIPAGGTAEGLFNWVAGKKKIFLTLQTRIDWLQQ
jgi:hypothetical protein